MISPAITILGCAVIGGVTGFGAAACRRQRNWFGLASLQVIYLIVLGLVAWQFGSGFQLGVLVIGFVVAFTTSDIRLGAAVQRRR